VLTTNIKELRRALADDHRQPRIIETAHRHGYRFIAATQISGFSSVVSGSEPETRDQKPGPVSLVGRETELAELDSCWQRARSRERQVVFVAGEPGIGKTTLVDAFLGQLSAISNQPSALPCLVARGQCIEQHGAGEPYLAVLEAFARLSLGPQGAEVRRLLRQHAPSWLIQLPGVLASEEIETLQRQLSWTTQERLLREAAAFVAALTVPLVLVLEDLHGSDNATLDLVAVLAQRRDPAALLIIGTYRPVDVVLRQHPLKGLHQELQTRRACRDVWLRPLGTDAVGAYVGARWPGIAAAQLARAIYKLTDGNPLFMVSMVDYLAREGLVAQRDGQWTLTVDVEQVGARVPEGLGQMIAVQIDRLDAADREMLEASGLIGQAFSSAAVAAALDADLVDVDAQLARLARNEHLVRGAGESAWPDGTVAGAYELIHSLYQRVLTDRLAPAVRRQMHQRIAARLETAYGDQATEIATELAFHFEAAGDPDRATRHLEEAASRAVRRGAYREAVALLEHGLALLDAVRRTPDRTLRTIRLSIALGTSLQPLRGFADRDTERSYQRARALAQETDDVVQLFQAVVALNGLYVAQARFDRAFETAAQMADLMARIPLPAFAFSGHLSIGVVHYHGGELAVARAHLDEALAFEELVQAVYPIDFRVVALNYAALTLMHQGFPEQACVRGREAAARAAAVGSPFDRGMTAHIACFVHLFRRDLEALARAADEARSLGDEYGLPPIAAVGAMAHGRVLVANGEATAGIAAVQDGLARYRATGQAVALPAMLASLAEAYAQAGQVEAALLAVAEARALVETTREQRYQAELHRLEGELRSARNELDVAERCFRRAIEIAQRQGARWWELRATVSLARLQLRQGRRTAAHRALAAIVGAITEGADTADVRDAYALMAGLARR
jgi:tetratricopeptide (TPR) repeat protein